MKTISVSTATFAALWAARKEGEETEDAILTRLLPGRGQRPPHLPAVQLTEG